MLLDLYHAGVWNFFLGRIVYAVICGWLYFLVASKYRRNCVERVQARQDVPMARSLQTNEELRLQSDHVQCVEQQKAMYVTLVQHSCVLVLLFSIYSACMWPGAFNGQRPGWKTDPMWAYSYEEVHGIDTFPFNALTLLVGWQDGSLAGKKLGVGDDDRPELWNIASTSINLSSINIQNGDILVLAIKWVLCWVVSLRQLACDNQLWQCKHNVCSTAFRFGEK